MSGLFLQMAADIREAFKEDLEARDVTFRRYSSTPNLVEGTAANVLQTSMVLPGLFLPASAGTVEAFDVRFMDGVVDATNLRFAIFAAEGAAFRPGPKDRAVLYADGREWFILGNTPINVDGVTDIVYSMGFRLP